VTREARDMREKRDMDGLDFHLVSPVPPVSLGHPARGSSVVPHVPAIEGLLCRNGFSVAC